MAPNELSARHQKLIGAIERSGRKVKTAQERAATATAAYHRAIYAALMDGVPTDVVREATGLTLGVLRRIRLLVARETLRDENQRGSQS